MKYRLKKKKAFTLIEITLVVVIIGVLAWVLFKTYITMSQISFRVEQQKVVNQELLFVSEFLQNMANNNEIDYFKYWDQLIDSKWITNILYMTWWEGPLSVFSSGDCVDLDEDSDRDVLDIWCNLFLNKNWKDIKLTSDGVYLGEVLFKIVPFANEETYLQDMSLCDSNYLACIDDPWFWFISKIYSIWYNSNSWTNNVSIFVQQFFNI